MREKCFHTQIKERCKAEEDDDRSSEFFLYPLSIDLSEIGFLKQFVVSFLNNEEVKKNYPFFGTAHPQL